MPKYGGVLLGLVSWVGRDLRDKGVRRVVIRLALLERRAVGRVNLGMFSFET